MKQEVSTGALIGRIWRHCYSAKPRTAKMLLRQTALFVRCLRQLPALRAWHQQNSATSPDLLARHPLMPAFLDRPYLSTTWTVTSRMKVIQDHYGQAKRFPIFGFAHDASTGLASLSEIEADLNFRLEKPLWFVNEGEVALSLFSGETRLYSLLFTLGQRNGVQAAYVGALQGINSDDARDIYRTLTHAAHGVRPRDLLFNGFRMLCNALAIENIFAVSDEKNARRSPYFAGGEHLHFSLDEAWIEYGGVLTEDGFYEISPVIAYRDPEDIPSRKRAQYRRRYEMLDSIAARIRLAVSPE
ncbi:MAG: DUF535 family protein [Rhizobacter sp.]